MAKSALYSGVREWYSKLTEETFAHCRLNEEQLTEQQIALFASLAEDTRIRYWGTGLVIPENLQGKRIFDIGCGVGAIVFILSKLVGPTGYVIGIDLSDDAIQTAKDQSEYHWKQWGYDKPNFEFRVLNADHLEATFPDEEFDIIVSSGVICLIPDKERVFRAAYKLLKPGGQFSINDIFIEKEAPQELKEDANLWSYGIVGTMQYDTLVAMATSAGFRTPHLTSVAPFVVAKEEYNAKLGYRRYITAGWRLFKLDPSRAKGAHKGPALVTYNGGITDFPDAFPWDTDLTFKKGEGVEVDEELATLLSSIYLSDCFSFKPASGHPVTRRGQNPFQLMDKMEAEGKLPEPICTKYRRYLCASWRLFKLDPSRAKGAHKGPALVIYNGGITDYPDAFPWDADLTFKKGEGVEVDEELATLLSSIYLSDCFSFKPASGRPVTRREQNPFQLMDTLEAEGKLPDPICTLK